MVKGEDNMKIKLSRGEKAFDIANYLFLAFSSILFMYPFIYIVFASLSDGAQLASSRGLMISPKGFSLEAYKAVLENSEIWNGYKNTIIYVVLGTSLNLIFTILGAYVLSRRDLYFKKLLMTMVVITMFFSGGMIPGFLLIKSLGMYNTIWALMLPGVISTWNLLIMRTSFMNIPASLEEAAKIDGANDLYVLFKVILPLSGSIIAVMVLFYGVGHWNSWLRESIYLKDRAKYPLQLILKEILIQNDINEMASKGLDSGGPSIAETIKYAIIVVATAPILMAYPYLQKYFVKGVMVGSVKG